MGFPGNPSHPDVEAAVLKILAMCKECGVACATVATQATPVETRLEQGFNIVMTSPVRSTDALTRGRQAAGRTD
jgi:2-keto-3-deoxy-L-rhamnonate aldolase RhmA